MNKLTALAVVITIVAAASGCTSRTVLSPGSAIAQGPARAESAGHAAKICSAARARSSPWRRNGWLSAQNKALSERIADDQGYLARHGIQLTQWGPDVRSGKTKIYLTHYTLTAARELYARYGCAVVVATTSEPRPSRGAVRIAVSGGRLLPSHWTTTDAHDS